jgi:hypothetical protein
VAALLFSMPSCAEKPAKKLAPPVAPAAVPARVVYAGVRSSKYGIKPFPEPAAWERAIGAMTAYFPGSTPCGIWIVGTMSKTPRFARLEFPAGGSATFILFPFFFDTDELAKRPQAQERLC